MREREVQASRVSCRIVRSVVAVGFLLGLGGVLAAPVDLALEEAFEGLLSDEAGRLEANQRLVPGKSYTEVDGGYEVLVVLDTAGDRSLKTERFRYRFQPAGKKWEIGERTLEETSERLVREPVEADAVYRFDAFGLDREGLKITATNGVAWLFSVGDEPATILVSASDLAYHYAPPGRADSASAAYGALKRGAPEKFEFAPKAVEISCDPASCRKVVEGIAGLTEIEAGSAAPSDGYDRRVSRVKQARQSDAFAGFRLPRRSVDRWLRVALSSKDDERWIALEHDGAAGHEVRFSVGGYDNALYGYPSASTRETVDPLTVERRDDEEGKLFQITDLTGTVEIGLVEPELLHADVTFTMQAKRDLDAIPFSLIATVIGMAPDKRATLYVSEIEDGQGRRLSWVRSDLSRGIVLLPETIRAGSELSLRMEFQTRGSVIKFNPSYSYVSRSGWLPFVRYSDKIDGFDLTVKVPQRYTTIGVGTKVSESREGKASVTRWKAQSPVHFPTIIFGVYQDDTPGGEARKSDGSEIPVTVYVDKTAMGDWQVRPGQLRPLGDIAVNALNIYQQLFGTDYPYGKLDLVNDPLEMLGAQAPASVVYLGSALFRSQSALSHALTRDTTTLVEEVVAHEVAHQWWGSLVSSANQRNYWFVESLAEYSSALFMEIMASEGYQKPEKGRKAYQSMVKRWHTELMRSPLLCSVQDSSTLWSNDGYVAAVYSKGPYVFHMLRQIFGDAKFFAFLKQLSQETSGKEIVTRDIQTIAERAFGGTGQDGQPYSVDLDWFFSQWVRGVGMPELRVEVSHHQTEDGKYAVEGKVRQRVFAGKHDVLLEGVYYRGVVPVTVLGKDKQEYSARVVVEGPETPFAFKVPVKPLDVTVNKYGETLSRPIPVN
ncbi:MAG: M1 family metallopeptidase [bacterium]|nr:M1 family metallopeptidase [bacterium]